MASALLQPLRAALPEGIGLGHGQDTPLWPGETPGPGALPPRLAEFRQGRHAARAAMAEAGFAPAPLPMGPDRAPIWPKGVSGSISHCQGACLAIAGARGQWAGLGLDLEPLAPIETALWPLILTPEELADLPPNAPGLAVLAAFCAKEAAYKAQYALTGQLFDFHSLIWRDSAAQFARTIGCFAKGDRLPVTLLTTASHQAALCLIPASAAPRA